MAKLIIWCPGRPAINGMKRRTFLWNTTYNCYVHENKVLTEQEFNSVVEAVFKKNQDLRPCARVVEFSEAPAAPKETPKAEKPAPVVAKATPKAAPPKPKPQLMEV